METIITDKFSFGGNCLTKINGKTVFVPFAVPGETLEVEIVQEKRDYSVAKIVRVVKPSKFRVEPPCPLYGTCGGCNMMHIDSEYQKMLRAEVLTELFERHGINVPKVSVISGAPLGYRARIQLNDGGFCMRGSEKIIDVSNCPIATKEIKDWLLKTKKESRGKGRICVFGSQNAHTADGKNIIRAEEKVLQELRIYGGKNAQKKAATQKGKKRYSYSGTTLSQQNEITVSLLKKEITFDVRGFFQSNLDVLEKSIKEICADLSGKNALDLYAGCGTFSVFLSEIFENVTLVEHNRDALVFAERNIGQKNHISYGLSGADWVKNAEKKQFDAAVIDPPRSGMEKAVCDYLCDSNIPQIRSVSCDPATHARDVARLIAAGYNLEKLFLLDFYPNTSHIESLAVLRHN